ncbi:MAG: ATP synthase F1 subunit gamma [Spartobacteria bacterium AMD-G4]|nr:MAG: ATP synthase F1 subunit gamma [Spartobacteria bacterium AMD-G4]
MANLRDIRRRIKSVKNTAQITKAMQMVAASKMRKAQQAALSGRDYAHLLNRVIVSLKDTVEESLHPLLQGRDVKNSLVILMSTDKGLCGALNTNILREALALDESKTQFVSIGRKGTQFLARTRRKVLADFPLHERPDFAQCKQVSKFCIEKFLDGTVDQVSILYPRFANTLSQIPTNLQILPITCLEEAGIRSHYEATPAPEGGFTFEPDATTVLNAILPTYLYYIVYQTQLSTRASEQSARMVAMKSATDNAKSLVKDLTLEYNKARQASITNEILEIATAQLALG